MLYLSLVMRLRPLHRNIRETFWEVFFLINYHIDLNIFLLVFSGKQVNSLLQTPHYFISL